MEGWRPEVIQNGNYYVIEGEEQTAYENLSRFKNDL